MTQIIKLIGLVSIRQHNLVVQHWSATKSSMHTIIIEKRDIHSRTYVDIDWNWYAFHKMWLMYVFGLFGRQTYIYFHSIPKPYLIIYNFSVQHTKKLMVFFLEIRKNKIRQKRKKYFIEKFYLQVFFNIIMLHIRTDFRKKNKKNM